MESLAPELREPIEAMLRSKDVLAQKKPELAKELYEAELEFKQIAKQALADYDHISRGAPKYQLLTIRVSVLSFPRQVILSGFSRSAINFYEAQAIVFDFEYWKQASPRERKLIALTEYLRFAGIEDEEDRYQKASEIVQLSEKMGKGPFILPKTFNPATEPFEVFDRHKVFIGRIHEWDTTYSILNSESNLTNPHLCRRPERAQNNSYLSAVERYVTRTLWLDPAMLQLCQSYILNRQNRSFVLEKITSNNMIVDCNGGL